MRVDTPWRAGFAIALWCVAAIPAAQADQRRIGEPVFHGHVQYYEDGPRDAPTVVLVHGLGDKAAHDWDGLARYLAGEFRVVRFDLPGFGHSSKANAAYTPESYASFLHYLAERHIRARPFLLVGHSMGGAIALRYAARYPEDVAGLVLIDVPGILHRSIYSEHLARREIEARVPGLAQLPNDPLDSLLGTAFGKVERKQLMPELVLQFAPARQKFLNGDPARIAGLALALEDFSRDIATVKTPTLILWGDRDAVAPLRTGRVLAAGLARARLEILKGSGHTPMDDVPQAFNARLREFLRAPQVESAGPALRAPLGPVASRRRGRCAGQADAVFEGEYERIEIRDCRGAIVRNARVQSMFIANSEVRIDDSRIGGAGGGLVADHARVVITASRIDGRVAITADAARLDVAGSAIVGDEAAVQARSRSEIVFSVSRVESPFSYGALHGYRVVTPQQSM